MNAQQEQWLERWIREAQTRPEDTETAHERATEFSTILKEAAFHEVENRKQETAVDLEPFLTSLVARGLCDSEPLDETWTREITQILVAEVKLSSKPQVKPKFTLFRRKLSQGPRSLWLSLVRQFMERIGRGFAVNSEQTFDLFTRLLQWLSLHQPGNYPQEQPIPQMTLSELYGIPVDGVKSQDPVWHPKNVVFLVRLLKEMDWHEQVWSAAITKIGEHLVEMDPVDVPPVVHQLLLLAKKGGKQKILWEVMGFLDRMNERMLDEGMGSAERERLAVIQGTLLLHVTFAMKQDQPLGTEFLKYIKAGGLRCFTLMNVAVLLAMNTIFRFENDAGDALKQMLLGIYKRQERTQRSPWMQRFNHWSNLNPGDLFQSLIDNCAYGWDEVVNGLVLFAFNTIDSQNRGLCAGRDFVHNCAINNGSPSDHASLLCFQIIFDLFKTQEMVREEVVTRLLNYLLIKSQNALPYLQMLHRLLTEYPQGLIPFIPKIRDTVDHICQWSRANAKKFLLAIQPLLKLNGQLRDSLFMTLKKGMFSREMDGRLTAATGLVQLMKLYILLDDMSCIQAIDVISMLRRCFIQQIEIKEAIYDDLYNMIDEYPNAAGFIFDLLHPRITDLVSDPDEDFPFEIRKCIDASRGSLKISENIARLIQCTSKCIKILDGSTDMSETRQRGCDGFKTKMTQIRRNLLHQPVDEMFISLTEHQSNHVFMENCVLNEMQISIYDALIDYTLQTDFSLDGIRSVVGLYEKRNQFEDVLKEKGKSQKVKNLPSLHFNICPQMICELFDETLEESNTEIAIFLQKHEKFVTFITSRHCQAIKTFYASTELNIAKLGQHIFNTTNALNKLLESTGEQLESDRIGFLVDSLCHLFSYLSGNVTNISELVAKAVNAESGFKNSFSALLGFLQPVLDRMLSHRGLHRDFGKLLHELCTLWQKRHLKIKRGSSVYKWLLAVCDMEDLNDPHAIRSLTVMLLGCDFQTLNLELLRCLSKDIHGVLGEYDLSVAEKEEPYECQKALVSSKNVWPIVTTIFGLLEPLLDDFDWAITIIKSEKEGPCGLKKSGDQQNDDNDKSIIDDGLRELVLCILETIKAPLHQVANTQFKALVKLYKVVANLTKYQLDTLPLSRSYVDLVAALSSELTPAVYLFITYVQQVEMDLAREKNEKSKKGKEPMAKKIKTDPQTKLIPNLIFQIETFEKLLIKLSNKSKVNLMKYCKRSTARDFRIQVDQLPQMDEDEGGETSQNEEE